MAGRRVLVVRCDGSGRCDRSAVIDALRTDDAELVWLTADGAAPPADVVAAADDSVVAATLAPVVDAVKEVDGDEIVRTVDRASLSTVVPPALLPRSIVEQLLADEGSDALLVDAVRATRVVALRSGG
ncbi:MAG: hypothetical protein AAFZ07_28210 [Actinomycetota bacterium]